MISLLSKGIPYTEKGNLIYCYEEGHKRFVLNCINKEQKLDETMYTPEEAKHVNQVLSRVLELLDYDINKGLPATMTKIIYLTIILNFLGLITLLICSDDFYNVITSEALFIILVSAVVTVSTVIIGIASYLYYSNAITFLQHQQIKIQSVIDDANVTRAHDLTWTRGEYGLWLRVERDDLKFFNESPEDLDEEVIDKHDNEYDEDKEADSEDFKDK